MLLFRSTAVVGLAVVVIGVASAGIVPELHVGVSSRDASDFTGSIEPSFTWTTQGPLGDCAYEVRIETNTQLQ